MLHPRDATSDNTVISNSTIGHLPLRVLFPFKEIQRSLLINNVCDNVDGQYNNYLEALYTT